MLVLFHLTKCYGGIQRQRRRLPVTGAGKAEHARGNGWGQMRGCGHFLAGKVLGPTQKRDVKTPPEQFGTGPSGDRGQCHRLIQRAHGEQLVDPCKQQYPASAAVNGRLGFRQKQRHHQTLQGGQGVQTLGRDAARDILGSGKPPETVRQSGARGGQQPRTIR